MLAFTWAGVRIDHPACPAAQKRCGPLSCHACEPIRRLPLLCSGDAANARNMSLGLKIEAGQNIVVEWKTSPCH